MRRVVSLFLLLLSLPLWSFDHKTAAAIYEKIFQSLFVHPTVNVYVRNKEFAGMFEYSDVLKHVGSEDAAHIAIVTRPDEIPKKRDLALFATDLELLEKHPNVIGAFYWDHGRPKILFWKSRLERFRIEPATGFQKYVQEGL